MQANADLIDEDLRQILLNLVPIYLNWHSNNAKLLIVDCVVFAIRPGFLNQFDLSFNGIEVASDRI